MSNKLGLNKVTSKILLFLLVFSVLGCTTQRKKGEMGKVGKMYHNTTAKYNGYFNANELVDESILTLKEMHVSNYASLIPVYDYVSVDNPTAVAENLDKAIEKVTTVTALHEESHWVDDCYVLMGKAQYLKHDYESAQETLEYFEEQFDPKNPYGRNYTKAKNKAKSKKDRKKEQKERVKEREDERKEKEKTKKEEKKEREKARAAEKKAREKARKQQAKNRKKGIRTPKAEPSKKTPKTEVKKTTSSEKKKVEEEYQPEEKKEEKKDDTYDGGLLKHRPAYFEGILWLSRTYIERERYQSAERLLNEIAQSPSLSAEVKRELPVAYAHLYISQKSYGEAIEHLNEAIDKAGDRNTKSRYYFIAAQIYERTGNVAKANSAYDRSMKLSQNYELSFNAQINKIKASHFNGKSSADNALSKFDRMLNDRKNFGYEGQIHFAMAEIHLHNGNIDGAQTELQNSLSSGGNTEGIQREAYYKLAGIFYEREKYVEAKSYYDSTLMAMTEEDERYYSVKNYSTNLDDIVDNINVIERQDSLLRLSTKTKEEIKEIAQELMKQSMLETERARAAGKKSSGINRSVGVGSAGKSSFFAYNPLSKSQGLASFKREWGQRSLEDNWRRSLRNNASNVEFEEEEEGGEEEVVEISEADLARIMKDIPRSPEAKAKAEAKIMTAMMELGILYRDRLQNYERSVAILEKLTNRFPEYEQTDQALYYLYLSYQDLDKNSEATKILNKLTSLYPNSQFTKLALDPSYAKELISDENKVEQHYNETFELFNNHKHDVVVDRVKEAIDKFGAENEFMPKYSLLKAMSVGSLKGEDAYIDDLKILIKAYPNTPEEVRAKEIMRFLQGDAEAFNEVLYNEASEMFEKDPEMLHYALIVLYELKRKQIDKVKISVSDFNKKYHRLSSLKISNITLNRENKSQIIMVRGFDSEEKAMQYYDSATKNAKELIKEEVGYDFFISTQKNFRELIKQRTVTGYRAFFDANYLENK